MGQYYNIVIQEKGQKKVHVYDRMIDGEYTMAKLMEHSWYLNPMVNAIAEKLYNTPSRIAWVGDYAKDKGDNLTLYKHAWERTNNDFEHLNTTPFVLGGKMLINHDKKLILDCWKYLTDVLHLAKNDDWVPHPLPLLTALGNGRGGGDYHGINEDKVGCWAWDMLEIVEYKCIEHKKLLESGYQLFDIVFKE